jgi:hypothetical protein
MLAASRDAKLNDLCMPRVPLRMEIQKLCQVEDIIETTFSVCDTKYVNELYAEIFSKMHGLERR